MIRTEKRPWEAGQALDRLLAVDTGLRDLGAALFEGDRLVKVSLVENPNKHGRDAPAWSAMADEVCARFPLVTELRCEMMVVRSGNRQVNPDDLMQLVGVAGVLVGRYYPAPAQVVRPEDWKGRVKKRIHHPRIIRTPGS